MQIYVYFHVSAFLKLSHFLLVIPFSSHFLCPVECCFVSDLKALPQPEVYIAVGEGGQREHSATLSAILTKSVHDVCWLFKILFTYRRCEQICVTANIKESFHSCCM